eukprot:CAMPEP_0202083858 /NCGR_PEP_ID=MMETSP0964-20121228/25492_1 /ASSEMBLY_ACC=CAM_ASM_000500 /TAXON_ID=4773 /ORGANISM="Schizochytrium aggregatum, Strain ATCC28209" /LENGTH=202 /DNA_ID=CAMNT_0048651599 /DNA_START=20 /DNA_END=628 /DNA_ORIENTATION=-
MWSNAAKTIRNALTFTRPIKDLAMTLADSVGLYNAIHVRRGDKRKEAGFLDVVRDADVYGQRMLPFINISRRLYVATDEMNLSYFNPIRELGFDLLTYRDLDQELLLNFATRFPLQMFRDVLGMIEQLICTYSYRFLGSSYSTFSLFILRIRRFFPALAIYNTTATDGSIVPHLPAVQADIDFATYKSTCNPFRPELHRLPC